ncbi:hypothetical protein AGLY_004038 [Aphis glycines]|uniref:Uncharacterized protein n=1 Tax=Aphis glycines TaxID=307491 RepID=A0A6G0TZ90_APHGL|nr:hypothetical protein AGLY_004038 [Aphis glycines]
MLRKLKMGNVFIAFCFYFALKRQHDSWNPNILRLYGVIKNTPCVCIITAGQPELFGYDSIKEHPSKSRRAVNYFENQNPPRIYCDKTSKKTLNLVCHVSAGHSHEIGGNIKESQHLKKREKESFKKCRKTDEKFYPSIVSVLFGLSPVFVDDFINHRVHYKIIFICKLQVRAEIDIIYKITTYSSQFDNHHRASTNKLKYTIINNQLSMFICTLITELYLYLFGDINILLQLFANTDMSGQLSKALLYSSVIKWVLLSCTLGAVWITII